MTDGAISEEVQQSHKKWEELSLKESKHKNRMAGAIMKMRMMILEAFRTKINRMWEAQLDYQCINQNLSNKRNRGHLTILMI